MSLVGFGNIQSVRSGCSLALYTNPGKSKKGWSRVFAGEYNVKIAEDQNMLCFSLIWGKEIFKLISMLGVRSKISGSELKKKSPPVPWLPT